MPLDVLVIGGGPAGRAVAAACGRRGLNTRLIDPAPDRHWPATYGAWAGELPAHLPAAVIAASAPAHAHALGTHELGWDYTVLNTSALRAHLDAELTGAGVDVRPGRARAAGRRAMTGTNGATDITSVELADGTTVAARLVIDAAGRRQPLAGSPAGRTSSRTTSRNGQPAAEQTAVGVVVDEDTAARIVPNGTALLMDWRPDHGEAGWPTFLYGIPLGGGAVLLEETSLARRPGLGLPALRRRLHARLAAHGVRTPADAVEERVRFPVDTPRHRDRPVLGFGAAAPLVHPATGYSVATALRLAPIVAAAAAGATGPPLPAARAALWPASARAVHVLRRWGLEAVLRMPAEQVPVLFDRFFALPAQHRWAYLTGREDLRGMTSAMAALFRGTDLPMGLRLVSAVRHRVR